MDKRGRYSEQTNEKKKKRNTNAKKILSNLRREKTLVFSLKLFIYIYGWAAGIESVFRPQLPKSIQKYLINESQAI